MPAASSIVGVKSSPERRLCRLLTRLDDAGPAHDAGRIDAWVGEVAFAVRHGHTVVAEEDDKRVVGEPALLEHVEHGLHVLIEMLDLLEIPRGRRGRQGDRGDAVGE